MSDAVNEFKKSKQISEEGYIKNIILGSYNACLMKILKESIDKIGNQKKKKDFGQFFNLALMNEFFEKIAMIYASME